jgi:GAF domain-containing protein
MSKYHEDGFGPNDLSVKVSELLIATADSSDELVDGAVGEVLALLRERMSMDVVFVSEFVDGRRVFRYVEQPKNAPVIPIGASDPLEETWCQRVVDGRLPEVTLDARRRVALGELPKPPFEIGTHLSTPILLSDGQVYGTLCCFSFGEALVSQQRDLKNLRSVAQLVARKIETRSRPQAYLPTQPLELVPKSPGRRD